MGKPTAGQAIPTLVATPWPRGPEVVSTQIGQLLHELRKDRPQLLWLPSCDRVGEGRGLHLVARPDNAVPQVPKGFEVSEYAADLKNPRYLLTSPEEISEHVCPGA